jgi:hypothetical protein
MTRNEKQCVCKALNKLFWKLPRERIGTDHLHSRSTLKESAEYIVAELADADIIIRWNNDKEMFEP